MPIPVRCFTCGKVIGAFETRIENFLCQGKEFPEIFDLLKIERYCCKRMLMSSVDLNTILLAYKQLPREAS